jgi:aspartate racemase
LRTGGSWPPIFFIHGLGAEVWSFVELAQHLNVEQVAYGLQPSEGSAGPTSITAMAELHVKEIRKIVPSGPFILAGFCSGAVTAFEVARQLRSQGHRVDLLIAIDHWSEETATGVGGFLMNLPFWFAEDLLHTSLSNNVGRVLSKLRLWRTRLWRRLGAANATEDIRDQLGMWRYPDHEIHRLRHFSEALAAYRFGPYDDPVHIFRARTRRLWGSHPSKRMGWDRVATGALTIETVPGSHDTMLRPPFVRTLARQLEAAVRARVRGPSK